MTQAVPVASRRSAQPPPQRPYQRYAREHLLLTDHEAYPLDLQSRALRIDQFQHIDQGRFYSALLQAVPPAPRN
jgi:hypothetical protein